MDKSITWYSYRNSDNSTKIVLRYFHSWQLYYWPRVVNIFYFGHKLGTSYEHRKVLSIPQNIKYASALQEIPIYVQTTKHDDVIKWKHFPRYWPFVRVIHRSPVNCPHKGQWRGALMFSVICAWINGWVNNHEACDLGRHRAHYDVIVMYSLPAAISGYH